MKPVIPTGPIETEPHRDPDWLRAQQYVAYTDEVRAQRRRDDAAIILDELAAAGVELGAYDRSTAAWLANWEHGTLVTIASWIKRADATLASANVEGLLTVEDVATFCAVPTKTVYEWNSNGTGPRRLRVGKHVRYRRADVDAWLDSQYAGGGA